MSKEEAQIWHKKLGHMSLKSVDKALKENVILGIQPLQINFDSICGECQLVNKLRLFIKRLVFAILTEF